MKKPIAGMFAIAVAMGVAAMAVQAAQLEKPNVVFILADDIGYGDRSRHGARLVQTPHIDRLAREGCRFTDAHATASTCTPTCVMP